MLMDSENVFMTLVMGQIREFVETERIHDVHSLG